MAKNTTFSVLLNSVLYTFGNMLLKVFTFFLIPLYTAYLEPDQYGILNLASGFTSFTSCILTLGLQYAVVRYYADLKDDKAKVARMFGTIICTIVIFGTISSIGLFVTSNYWSPLFFRNIDFYPIVALSVLNSFVTSLYLVYQDALKGMQEARKSLLMTYIFFFLLLGANVFTVVILGMGTTGILVGTLFVHVIMIVIMIIDLLRRELFVPCIDGNLLKNLLKYSLPIVPHTMSYNITTLVSKIIINGKMSASSLGIYSLASQFGSVSDIALNSVQFAFQPWMFGRLNESNKGTSFADITKISYLLMWLYGLMYIIIGAFSEEAISLMASSSYKTAWTYVPVMVFAVALKGPLYFYNNFLYYDKKKTGFIFITTLVGSIVNIIMTWILVPIYGIYGSIVADLLGMISRLFIVIPVVYVQAKDIYSFVKLTILSLVPMLFMGAAIVPPFIGIQLSLGSTILYKLFVILLYVFWIYIIYRKMIRNYICHFLSTR